MAPSFSCLVGLPLARHEPRLLEVTQNNVSCSPGIDEVDGWEFLRPGDCGGEFSTDH
jgi:hypothetical protein